MNIRIYNSFIAPLLQEATNTGYLNFRNINLTNDVINNMSDTFVKCGVCINGNIGVVMYRQGKIAFYDITNCRYGGISFEFSGCALVQFSHLGQKYIAHISLHDVNNPFDTRTDWNSFLQTILANELQAQFTNFILFKPFDKFAKREYKKNYPNVDCCGIIDNNDNCYSAILNKSDYRALDMWTVAKIVRVQNLTNVDFSSLLL